MKTLLFLLLFALPLNAQWNDTHDFANKNDRARQVFIVGEFVVSIGQPLVSNALDCAVRVYDKSTGTLLWMDQQAAVGSLCIASVSQNRVYMTMDRAIGGLFHNIVVRAYELAGGNLAWEREIDTGRDDRATAIASSSQLVAITGYGYNVNPGDKQHGLLTVFNLDGDVVLQEDLGLILGWGVSLDNQHNLAFVGHEETASDWTTRLYNLTPQIQAMRQQARDTARAERQASRTPKP